LPYGLVPPAVIAAGGRGATATFLESV